jgi:hypothetical protein
MKKLHHLGPVFIVAAFPALLLTTQSTNMLRILWGAAMFGLSSLAGESLAHALPRAAILGLVLVSVGGIAATLLFGWLTYGAPTPVDLGNIALLTVAIVVPLRAAITQHREAKAE